MKKLYYIVLLLLQVTNICGFTDLNLIRRIRAEVTTNQSSIYSPPNKNLKDYNSDKAIDGIQNYSVNTCKCCSVTYGNSPSWWQIDLAQKYLIGALQIFGRADLNNNKQLEHAVVYAWNMSVGSHMTVNMTKIYEIPTITTSQIFTKQLDPIIARFFVVKLFQQVLTLCEFKLFEKECVIGKFGNGCMRNCHCSDNKTCNQITGKCGTPGCLPGWQGDSCETECVIGKFGNGCMRICHCSDNKMCNQITGKCGTPGCLPGWQGDSCETECQMNTFGENCSGRCHCKNTTDCRKHDGYCINGCALGWKGFNCSEDLNLIRRIRAEVTTYQSSIYSPNKNPQDFNSDKAIDGIQNYSVNTCKCCSVTDGDSPSWWQIDLAQKYLIGALQIFGRAKGSREQLEKAVVYAWNISVGSQMTVNMTKIYEIPTKTTPQIFRKQLDPIVARFFVVKLYQRVLTLCEFKLFEKECVVGKFGNGCMRYCHCSDNKTCNQITGKCGTPDCLPGWHGNSCETVCDARKFGDECNKTCNCVNGSSCVNTNGTCYIQRCEPGWLLPSCSEICQYRNFGDGCNNICHCKGGTNCNHISGRCDTGLCEPGWLLPTCSKRCGHRTFGDNCSSVCHCLNDSSCDAVSGECDLGRCDPGWRTSSCDKGGNLINTIKRNIKTEMSSVARNTNSTLAVDGLLGPDPDKCNCCSITSNSPLSWWLLDLGKQYPLSSIIIYGRNKEKSYMQLTGFNLLLLNKSIENKPAIYNESLFTTSENIYEILLNNTLARYIKIERPGVLTVCEVKVFEGYCKNGTFGEECSLFCHCADNKPCDQLHGYCQSPICKLGWIGESCNASCPQNTFGEGCDQLCYCKDGTCASDYGDCPGKCKTGYHGAHCNIPFDLESLSEAEIEHHTSAGIIGGSVAGGVVVIVGLVLLFVFIFKHRIKRIERSESENYYKTISRNMRQHDDETYDTIDISREATQGQVNVGGGYDGETSTGL